MHHFCNDADSLQILCYIFGIPTAVNLKSTLAGLPLKFEKIKAKKPQNLSKKLQTFDSLRIMIQFF